MLTCTLCIIGLETNLSSIYLFTLSVVHNKNHANLALQSKKINFLE